MMGHGPLEGVRIIDLTRVLAGPFASMVMGDMGAEVIKVEPEGGDGTRGSSSDSIFSLPDELRHKGESAYFMSVNRNKKSVVINLKKDEGRKLLLELAKASDVVFENFRPGVMDRLGLGYEALREAKPDIICCSVSGFGSDGPMKDFPAFDLIIQAMSGAMSITGEPGRDPVRAGIPIGDLGGGTFAALAIVSALYHREKTGKGQWIDMSLLDCHISLLTYIAGYYLKSGVVPKPIGSGHQTSTPYGAYKTHDYYIVITAGSDKFWAGLCRAMGREELISDERFATQAHRLDNRKELEAMVADELQKKTTGEWVEILAKEGVPAAPVNTVDKALSNPQVLHRNMVAEMEHSLGGKIRFVGNPFKMEGISDSEFSPPPLLGEHTEYVLREILGKSDAEIKALREAGVVR